MGTNPYPNQSSSQKNQYSGYAGYTSQSSQQTFQQADANYQYGRQQAQQEYQPPLSAQRGRGGMNEPSSSSMSPGNAAMLSYAVLFLSGFVMFFVERKNRFVRFCAAQSFLFFGAIAVIYGVLNLIVAFFAHVPLVGFILGPLLGALVFFIHMVLIVIMIVAWVFLIIQAYRGIKVKIPYFGNYAEWLVARFTR